MLQKSKEFAAAGNRVYPPMAEWIFESRMRGALAVVGRRALHGIMNTHVELAQAFEDYQAGRLGTIPAA